MKWFNYLIVFLTVICNSSKAQDFPDQNKHYALINKATGHVFGVDNILKHGSYSLISATLRMASAGYKENEVNWKFSRISRKENLYTISMRNSELTLDAIITNNSFYDAIYPPNLIVHKPHGKINQRFYLISTGEKNTFYIVCAPNSYAIASSAKDRKLEGNTPTRNIVIQEIITGSDLQKWLLVQTD